MFAYFASYYITEDVIEWVKAYQDNTKQDVGLT